MYNFLKPAVFTCILGLQAISISHTSGDKPCMKSLDDELMHFNRNDLNDSACFTWFRPAYRDYKPNPAVIAKLKPYRKALTATAFAGSWCEDTRIHLPRFYKVMESAKVPAGNITLVPVDRKKKSADGTAQASNIDKAPTFIFYHKGKEIGRIIVVAPVPMEEEIVKMLEKK